MGLSRLAALHGVATSYSPSPDVTVSVPDDTVIAVLAALGVDAGAPEAVRRSLVATESRSRLLPPTVVVWAGEPLPPALTGLPPGSTVRVEPESAAGGGRAPGPDRPPEPGASDPRRTRTVRPPRLLPPRLLGAHRPAEPEPEPPHPRRTCPPMPPRLSGAHRPAEPEPPHPRRPPDQRPEPEPPEPLGPPSP